MKFSQYRFPYSLVVTAFCFGVTIYIAYPGWMSFDSLVQYEEAQRRVYNDWHPVFLAWWWSRLLHFSDGPVLIFIQMQVCYWLAWHLLGHAATRRGAGKAGAIVPLIGLWPGLAYPLGHVWKDIFFAVHMLLAWSLLIWLWSAQRRAGILHILAVSLLSAFAVGSKINGVVAVPFLFFLIALLNGWRMSKAAVGAAVFTAVSVAVPKVLTAKAVVIHTPTIQYIQSHDLLAASVATGTNQLPEYIKEKVGSTPDEIRELYFVGSNNKMFYGTNGNIATTDVQDLSELQSRWVDAITQYPLIYLEHRWLNFASLLRLGEPSAGYVGEGTILRNSFGLSFEENFISSFFVSSVTKFPWMYFPWLYLLAGTVFALVGAATPSRLPIALLWGSAAAFVAPHLFIAPASDFRYLYYAYLVMVVVIILVAVDLLVGRSRNVQRKH